MQTLNLRLPGLAAQSYDPMLLGRMKVDTLNSIPGDLTGHDCPKCLNRGNMAYLRKDGSFYTSPCDCMRIRRCVWEMERSGLKNVIRDLTFESFQTEQQWQKIMKEKAMAFAQDPTGWLLLCGQSGCGKTHLCTAVCRQRLLSSDEVRYMPWRDSIAQLKACSLDSDQRFQMLNGYKTAQLLYIDDLFKMGMDREGKCTPSQSDVNLAFELINHRYINHLTTIVSTEKTPQELLKIDEAIGSRILEMAGRNVLLIGRDQSRNYRLRQISSI